MEYHEAVEYLGSLQRRRPKLGTETTEAMLSALGDPQTAFDAVQIAGSNGKGSTAAMLSSILETAGLSVGLYTSPALNDVRERIRVDGRVISSGQLAAIVDDVAPAVAARTAVDDEPTHFEVLTVVALEQFRRQDVDVAVLEVGIGGRYDATSAVDPVAAAVTSVSLEHTDLLGDTVAEIARDKAQVAPDDRPLVTGADGEARAAIRDEADAITVGTADSDVTVTETPTDSTETAVSITGPGLSVETRSPLLGRHQAINAGVAATLAGQLGVTDPDSIGTGLRRVQLPGRFEIVSRDPLVVLDGAHNPGACAALSSVLDRYSGATADLRLVFGAMTDKDHRGMIEALPSIDAAYLCRPNTERAVDPTALESLVGGTTAVTTDSVLEATERAITDAGDDDLVVVTGSLSVVAEARDRWTYPVIPKESTRGNPLSGVEFGPEVLERHADDLRYHSVKCVLRRPQAERLRRVVRSTDATYVEADRTGRPAQRPAVIAGTETQLRTVLGRLPSGEQGLSHVADQLKAVLQSPDATADLTVVGVLDVRGRSGKATPSAVRRRAERMIDAGVDVVDLVGTAPDGESTAPDDEADRLLEAVEALSGLPERIAVTTHTPEAARAALDAGAGAFNDPSGLSDPELRAVAGASDASVFVTHSASAATDLDASVEYDDIVERTVYELSERLLLAERAGIDHGRLVVGPSVDFASRPEAGASLLDRLGEFRALERPVVFDSASTPRPEGRSDVSTAAVAVDRGADVLRLRESAVHPRTLETLQRLRGD
ncbi:MAG: dihydropteroate synthase [Natronomonas sp.]